ncbi:MAG: DUF4157 domain-containing protein [Flavobacterium sp.]
MVQQHEKILENKSSVTAAYAGGGANAVQLKNNREYSVVQRKLAEGTATTQLASFMPVQRKVNYTGLPDNLKSGIESLSGHSMDDVKVHYNSDKPAQLNAHAYAQGTDIHIASGQEKHLPHEAWHVVQQKQGRVKPTLQMKGKVNVNDDSGLEKEADVMGAKALQTKVKEDNHALTNKPETITQRISQNQESVKQIFSNSTDSTLPIQRAEKNATVAWGITHIVKQTANSLFGEKDKDALANELRPNLGGQLKKGDKLIINDAPVFISRRGSNQENKEKRAYDEKGEETVYEWVQVLKIIRDDKPVIEFSEDDKMYVRKETLQITEDPKQENNVQNKIELENIEDWDGQKISEQLGDIAIKWGKRGLLKRTRSSGVIAINNKDRGKQEEDLEHEEDEPHNEEQKGGQSSDSEHEEDEPHNEEQEGSSKGSGRHWEQEDDGWDVAADMAYGKHEPFDKKLHQWRIKAVEEKTKELVGVLIVEQRWDSVQNKELPLYLRWMVGNPDIKGGGSALLAAVKILLKQSGAASIEVKSAYTAMGGYKKAGFVVGKHKEDTKDTDETVEKDHKKGVEYKMTLTKENPEAQKIHDGYKSFVPKPYADKKITENEERDKKELDEEGEEGIHKTIADLLESRRK